MDLRNHVLSAAEVKACAEIAEIEPADIRWINGELIDAVKNGEGKVALPISAMESKTKSYVAKFIATIEEAGYGARKQSNQVIISLDEKRSSSEEESVKVKKTIGSFLARLMRG